MSQVLVRNRETGKHEWVDKSEAARLPERGVATQTYTEVKPFYSHAAACHPGQVEEFNAMIRDLNLSASLHHLPDGTLRCTSRGALNEYLRERGMFNADAGYGDYAGS